MIDWNTLGYVAFGGLLGCVGIIIYGCFSR